MTRFVLVDGRFSWPFIGVVVFLTVSLVGFDFVWRLVKIPLISLVIYATLVDLATALAVILICLSLWRRSST
ncbi:MAG TPA: hypothetical protein VGR45_11120 [Stellaceae bacterium]|nr:hypothetical protein [Stellaceae bacterium]